MKIITLLIVLLLLPLVIAQPLHYYQVDLQYDNETVSLIKTKVILSNEGLDNYGESYAIDLISFDNKTLNTTYFSFPLKLHYDYIDENGTIMGGGINYLNKTTTTVYAPYYANAKEIQVFDSNFTKKLTVKVSDYSQEVPEKVKKNEQKQVEQTLMTNVEKKIKEFSTTKLIGLIAGLFVFILIMAIGLTKSIRKKKALKE